jgi:hypothetical protein
VRPAEATGSPGIDLAGLFTNPAVFVGVSVPVVLGIAALLVWSESGVFDLIAVVVATISTTAARGLATSPNETSGSPTHRILAKSYTRAAYDRHAS